MTKFFGTVGFVKTVNKGHGVWEEEAIDKKYYGDILSNRRRWQETDKSTNADLTISNVISIIADSFAMASVGAMRYVEVKGVKWTISSVEIKWPRIELTLGGVYNE